MAGTAAWRAARQRAWPSLVGLLLFVVVGAGLLPVVPARATGFVVDSTSDSDDGNCGGSDCTLREAINAANANNNQPGFDTITFDFSGTTLRTFNIASALPNISEPLIIDGRTHAAADDKPLIKFDGGNGDYDGIRANAGGSAQGTGVWLLSLIIVRFGQNGVEFNSTGGNIVSNCYIGIDTGGANLGNGLNGVRINGSDNNIIGPTFGGGGNFISRNGASGVLIERVVGFPAPPVAPQQSTGNLVTGNFIGSGHNGSNASPNGGSGVHITRAGNTVGGSTASERNIISGNTGAGVSIFGASATGNTVAGNWIGMNSLGTATANNFGVTISSGATGNMIGGNNDGGPCSGSCNLISGNGSNGVNISDSGANTVRGNVIGLTLNAGSRLPNSFTGIEVLGNSSGVVIGGATAGDGNIIAGNNEDGIQVFSAGVTIQGNFVGTNSFGNVGLFNAGRGIRVSAANCVIGGNSTAARNVVSGNGDVGILLFAGAVGCQVLGNYIGIKPIGADGLANTGHGIRVEAANVTVGDNVVSGNGGNGISLETVTGASVRGNRIGLNAPGVNAVSNALNGISLSGLDATNTIGGLGAGEGNVISGNTLAGIEVKRAGPSILGNVIGLNFGGSGAVPNGGSGILLNPSVTPVVGSLIRSNTISGNTQHGVDIRPASTANTIANNRIGTNALGTAPVPNADHGILVSGPDNVIGGPTVADRNLISGNRDGGVLVVATASGTAIKGNYIGVNGAGIAAIPNGTQNFLGGVFVNGAPNVTVGGPAAGEGNVISGNLGSGIELTGAGASGTNILGNTIGTNSTGTTAISNTEFGVWVTGGADQVRIGQPGAGNLISGNSLHGVLIDNGSTDVTIEANLIGTNAAGTAAIPNGQEGVYLFNADHNTIGGIGPGAGNVISGNTGRGVRIEGMQATGNTVLGNLIGTNAAGTATLGNGNHGIHLFDGAHDNVIGGASPTFRNIISGNAMRGVYLFGNTTSGNTISGNYIGTDATGAVDLGNGDGGVVVEEAPNTRIGGGEAALRGARAGFSSAGNVISGNVANGVEFNGDAANGIVQGNFIGTDATGTVAIPNDLDGVRTDADGTKIGGKNAGQANLISGNKADGIRIQGAATGTVVQGNGIGTKVDGISPLPNGSIGEPNNHGIRVFMNATESVIGGTAEGEANVIAFNPGDGIRVEGANAIKHAIRGNSIHSNGGKGIETFDGGNTEPPPPVILAVGSASGTACSNCFVDVFSDSIDEGRVYEGSVQANGGGAWSFVGAVSGPFVTATATDANGNTSEFSAPVAFATDTSFPLVAGATGHLWTGDPVPLAQLGSFVGLRAPARAFNVVSAVFRWENTSQQFQFWFRGFPDNFQTLQGGLQTGEFYFFQSPGNTTVTVPNGTLFTVPNPGQSFQTLSGATGQLWSGSAVALAQLDDVTPPGLPSAVSALFRWENTSQQFQFWFRGFPDNFQTLSAGLLHGEFYFFQASQSGIVITMN
jgi:CSLREA domain-containing protein